MPLTISNESKNNVVITDENKPSDQTWSEMAIAWGEEANTWAQPGTPIIKESKNNITITNENKN